MARFVSLDGEKTTLSSKADADRVLARCKDANFIVSAIKRSERRKFPAPPFTTSNLQQEASRKLGFTTQKTMQIAQQLYEGVELERRRLAGSGYVYPYRLDAHGGRGD